jgi:hypothetical protein
MRTRGAGVVDQDVNAPERRDESGPPAAENAAWVGKYATEWERAGMTAESFAQRFSVPVRIRIGAIHGF